MAWGELKFDCYYRLPGVGTVVDYLLKNHNIKVPPKRPGEVTGVTIASYPLLYGIEKEDAKEYVKNLTSDGFIPHIINGYRGPWKVLDYENCWQREDGRINDKTICIACIIASNAYPYVSPAGVIIPPGVSMSALRDTAHLTAYFLHKYKLPLSAIKVTKDCSPYITSRWSEFKKEVRAKMKKL